ncbi:MAG: DUF1015 domain-containing protein [Candidatus Riflebacteria bacterium]|nr:DUF1015 domain-containing protein [Candidatus Riflebacteria bacterium]
MSVIKPFCAYRPRPELARNVASFPYDVLSSDEARELARGNPVSFLHVGKPEIDLDGSISLYDDRVYARGRENLYRMISDGTLVRDPAPCLYVYQQRMGAHVQAGVVVACSVREYESGLIKRHEHTRRDKEDDRTRHVTETNAQAEPVFLAYRAHRTIDALVDNVRGRPPVYDFVSTDGIGHALWVVSDRTEIDALVERFFEVPCLYVADGHHRTAAAVRHAQMTRGKHGGPGGQAPCETFMAVLFPHDQLRILDYNRLVKDLNGLTPDRLLERVGERFTVEPTATAKPAAARTFGMLLDGRWHRLQARPGSFPDADPIKRLDVSILQDNLLAPVLGVVDPRTDKRIDFVGGIRGMGELERRCREGWAVAFSLHPTSLDQLMEVADAGQVMPPKSTWFEPKLRSGLTVRILDE